MQSILDLPDYILLETLKGLDDDSLIQMCVYPFMPLNKKLQRVCEMDGDLRKRIRDLKLPYVFHSMRVNTAYNPEDFRMGYVADKVDIDYDKPYDYAQVMFGNSSVNWDIPSLVYHFYDSEGNMIDEIEFDMNLTDLMDHFAIKYLEGYKIFDYQCRDIFNYTKYDKCNEPP